MRSRTNGMCAVFFGALMAVGILASATGAELPPVFDLRFSLGENYVTSVKNQLGGTCWTHGTMASIESNLLMTGRWAAAGETDEPNLAEYHLDWWNGFNTYNNDDIGGASGDGLIPHEGGDYLVATAYLARGEGAVRDIDGQSFGSPPARYDEDWHYYYPRDVVWLTVGDELENIEAIKQTIVDYGAIGTCMLYDEAFINDNYLHYQPMDSGGKPNHAIAIVGWNDLVTNMNTPGDGAWLCKNSWGAGWANLGYFYISYYDQHCGHNAKMGAVSYQNVVPWQWDKVYYHDYHGWRATHPTAIEAFTRFDSEGGELLRAVSFYTAKDSVDYTVSIFDSFTGSELTGLLATISGHIDYRGFHTVDLDPAAILADADDFYVHLSLSRGGHAYDRTSIVPVLLGADQRVTVPSTASEGESYYLTGGDWVDLTTYSATGSFCMKGLSDFVVAMECDTTWGWVPFDVELQGSADLDADTWQWDFGDGETGSGQTVSHSFATGGLHDVTLTVNGGGEEAIVRKRACVAALADTMWAESLPLPLGTPSSGTVTIHLRNNMPLSRIQVPFQIEGDLSIDPHSATFSTGGCRTEGWDGPTIYNENPPYNQWTVRITLPDSLDFLPAGEGPILKVSFDLIAPQQVGQQSVLKIGYNSLLPILTGDRATYAAVARDGSLYCPECCVGFAGNIDFDPLDEIDISDLINLTNYMFQDGPEPACERETDIDGNGVGPDIADLIHLVTYMFQDGPPPANCD